MVLKTLGTALTVASLCLIGAMAALTVDQQHVTGTWGIPTLDHIEMRARTIQSTFAEAPSKVIYLHRDPIEVRPGVDDAVTATSSVLLSMPESRPRRLPGFKGGDRRWRKVTRCVARGLAPFDVEVTDRRPPSETPYILVAVGGRARDLGMSRSKSRRTAGLAPLRAGRPVPRAVVFAFSRTLKHHVRQTCETILHEIGHAYGLEHVRSCKDLMGYGKQCGKRFFADAPKTCGERRSRPCATGRSTQNAFDYLMNLLGPRQPQSASTDPHERQEDDGPAAKSTALAGGA